MEMFGPHPGRGFGGVADGVVGGIAEHDAALGLGRLEAGDPQQLADVDAVVDPGDEQLAPLALGEQLQPGGKALAAAGQHHDGIGAALGLGAARGRRLMGNRRGEADQPGEPGRGQQTGDLKPMTHPPPHLRASGSAPAAPSSAR